MSQVNVEVQEEQDWFLEMLVGFANKDGMSFGITLQVSGILVSGTLVSGDKYFDGFTDDWTSMIQDEEWVKAYREGFSKLGSVYKSNAEEENKEEVERTRTTFIHLQDARFFGVNDVPIPTGRGVWWRGRISEVAGFTLGSLSVEEKS